MKYESVVEASIVREIKKAGGLSIKMLLVTFSGLPDRLCILPFKPMFFVEVKRPGETPRRLQLSVHNKLRKLGVKVFVVDNITDFRNAIQTV